MVVATYAFVALAALTSSLPLSKRQTSYDGGEEAARAKKAFTEETGADAIDHGVATVEYGSAYKVPDSGTNNPGKSGDSAVYGIYNQNWYDLRNTCDKFKGQGADDYQNAAVLDKDNKAATECWHQLREYAGDQGAIDRNRDGCPDGCPGGPGGSTSLNRNGGISKPDINITADDDTSDDSSDDYSSSTDYSSDDTSEESSDDDSSSENYSQDTGSTYTGPTEEETYAQYQAVPGETYEQQQERERKQQEATKAAQQGREKEEQAKAQAEQRQREQAENPNAYANPTETPTETSTDYSTDYSSDVNSDDGTTEETTDDYQSDQDTRTDPFAYRPQTNPLAKSEDIDTSADTSADTSYDSNAEDTTQEQTSGGGGGGGGGLDGSDLVGGSDYSNAVLNNANNYQQNPDNGQHTWQEVQQQ